MRASWWYFTGHGMLNHHNYHVMKDMNSSCEQFQTRLLPGPSSISNNAVLAAQSQIFSAGQISCAEIYIISPEVDYYIILNDTFSSSKSH